MNEINACGVRDFLEIEAVTRDCAAHRVQLCPADALRSDDTCFTTMGVSRQPYKKDASVQFVPSVHASFSGVTPQGVVKNIRRNVACVIRLPIFGMMSIFPIILRACPARCRIPFVRDKGYGSTVLE